MEQVLTILRYAKLYAKHRLHLLLNDVDYLDHITLAKDLTTYSKNIEVIKNER